MKRFSLTIALIKKFINRAIKTALARYLAVIFLLTLTPLATAHVKWFIEEDQQNLQARFVFDGLMLVIFIGALLFLLCAHLLERRARRSDPLKAWLEAPLLPRLFRAPRHNVNSWVNSLLKFSVGIVLLANILQGHFVAPNFVAPELSQATALQYSLVQALLILLLIINVSLFALALLVFSLLLFWLFPLSSAIDYAPEFIALALALFFTDRHRLDHVYQWKWLGASYSISSPHLGLLILQFGLGLQLIILTFHDKLLAPGYGIAFLQQYPAFNFPHYFGMHAFTDIHFVFAAGMAELCFGLLLVCNLAPRLSQLLVLLVFTLTGVVLGPEELVGHAPIIAAATVLLFNPGGSLLLPVADRELNLAVD